jgi:DNA-binding transcriptional ArsR family regulator
VAAGSVIGPDKVVKGGVLEMTDSAPEGAASAHDVAPSLGPALRAELVELTATLCKALNDPKRLMVLYALADGPHSVGALAEAIGASQANVSQHLALLRDRGLVDTRRHGNRIIYSLRYPEVVAAVEQLRGVLAQEIGRRQELVAG